MHKDGPHAMTVHTGAILVIVLTFTSIFLVSFCRALRKGKLFYSFFFVFFLVILSQTVGRELEMFIWRVVIRYQRKLEEFRNQSSLQVDNKTAKTINRGRISTRLYYNFLSEYIFFCVQLLWFLTKIITVRLIQLLNKSFWFCVYSQICC